MQTIEAEAGTLLRQAPMTVDSYLGSAVRGIDQKFGSGYARENPGLVAAYMQACAADLSTSISGAIAQDAAESISGAIRELSEAVAAVAEARSDG